MTYHFCSNRASQTRRCRAPFFGVPSVASCVADNTDPEKILDWSLPFCQDWTSSDQKPTHKKWLTVFDTHSVIYYLPIFLTYIRALYMTFFWHSFRHIFRPSTSHLSDICNGISLTYILTFDQAFYLT